MRTLHTKITVDAPPALVWAMLVDLERYPDWNPFAVEAHGRAGPGARLRVVLAPPGGRRTTLRPRVTAFAPEAAFEWLGHLGVPGIFDGRHRFRLTPIDGGRCTRFEQAETFTGVLVPFVVRKITPGLLAGFQAMNQALKARAEQAQAAARAATGAGAGVGA